MARYWEKEKGTIAERLMKDDFAGIFKKRVFLRKDEKALIEENGEIVDELGEGEHKIYLGYSGEKNLILMDVSEKSIRKDVVARSKEGKNVVVSVTIYFKVGYPARIFRMLQEEKRVDIEHVWNIVKDRFSDFLKREIIKKEISDMDKEYKNYLKAKVEFYLKKIFKAVGIELRGININLMYDVEEAEKERYLKEMLDFDGKL